MNMLSPQTQLVFHYTTALDPADRMLDPHSDPIDATILVLLFICQFSSTRLFLWLNDHHTVNFKALKSHVLIQLTSCWKMIAFTVSCSFVMTRSFPGLAQTPHSAMLINNDDILDRVILLFAAVIPFLFFWITWPIYRPLRSIMNKKGVDCSEASPSVCISVALVTSLFTGVFPSANSMRMSRFGMSPFRANARLSTGCKR
jgi:hypothetical protein